MATASSSHAGEVGQLPAAASEMPRQGSRHISFRPDDALLSGHVTVFSGAIRSVLQTLARHSEEHTVLIGDLQDQILSMKSRATKAALRAATSAIASLPQDALTGRGATAASLTALGTQAVMNAGAHYCPDSEALKKRVAVLEGFVALFGATLSDVGNLHGDFGSPVVIPEEYTAYLLSLPIFTGMRQEVHRITASLRNQQDEALAAFSQQIQALVIAAATNASANAVAAQHDASRPGSPGTAPRNLESLEGNQKSRSETAVLGTPGAKNVAGKASNKRENAAQDEGEDVEQSGGSALSSQSHQNNSVQKSSGGAKDKSARSNGGGEGPKGEVVDSVAREEAASSLKQVQRLEREVMRRLKDIESATAEKSRSSKKERASSSHGAAASSSDGGGSGSGSGGGGGKGSKGSSGGSAIDAVAREDAAVCMERLDEFENEMQERWKKMEERMRLVGRASSEKKKGGASGSPTEDALEPSGGGGGTTDRKARENISQCNMRIQQLEKDMTALKKNMKAAASASSGDAHEGEAPQQSPAKSKARSSSADLPPSKESQAPRGSRKGTIDEKKTLQSNSSDREYMARMQNLEEEVARRMAEVNRALSSLDKRGQPQRTPREKSGAEKVDTAVSKSTARLPPMEKRKASVEPSHAAALRAKDENVEVLQDVVDSLVDQMYTVQESLESRNAAVREDVDALAERVSILEGAGGTRGGHGDHVALAALRALGRWSTPPNTGRTGSPVPQNTSARAQQSQLMSLTAGSPADAIVLNNANTNTVNADMQSGTAADKITAGAAVGQKMDALNIRPVPNDFANTVEPLPPAKRYFLPRGMFNDTYPGSADSLPEHADLLGQWRLPAQAARDGPAPSSRPYAAAAVDQAIGGPTAAQRSERYVTNVPDGVSNSVNAQDSNRDPRNYDRGVFQLLQQTTGGAAAAGAAGGTLASSAPPRLVNVLRLPIAAGFGNNLVYQERMHAGGDYRSDGVYYAAYEDGAPETVVLNPTRAEAVIPEVTIASVAEPGVAISVTQASNSAGGIDTRRLSAAANLFNMYRNEGLSGGSTVPVIEGNAAHRHHGADCVVYDCVWCAGDNAS